VRKGRGEATRYSTRARASGGWCATDRVAWQASCGIRADRWRATFFMFEGDAVGALLGGIGRGGKIKDFSAFFGSRAWLFLLPWLSQAGGIKDAASASQGGSVLVWNSGRRDEVATTIRSRRCEKRPLAAVAAVEQPESGLEAHRWKGAARVARATLAASSPADNNAAPRGETLLHHGPSCMGEPFLGDTNRRSTRSPCPPPPRRYLDRIEATTATDRAAGIVSCGTTCTSPAGCGDGPRKNPPQRAEVPAQKHHRHEQADSSAGGLRDRRPQRRLACRQLGVPYMVIGLPPLLRPSLLFGSNREAGGCVAPVVERDPHRCASHPQVSRRAEVVQRSRRRAHSRSQVVTPVTPWRPSSRGQRACRRQSGEQAERAGADQDEIAQAVKQAKDKATTARKGPAQLHRSRVAHHEDRGCFVHYCYSGQAVVDEKSQVVLAGALTSKATDVDQLNPDDRGDGRPARTRRIEDHPKVLLADAGYCSNDNLEALAGGNLDALVATAG